MRKLKAKDVTFTLEVEPEQEHWHGNCSAIDPETDKEQESWIAGQVNEGNEYAWCWAAVTATDDDGNEGYDSLGMISCTGREEFERVFLPELQANALADLNTKRATRAKEARSSVKRGALLGSDIL